ncbi:uncharacterized protein LOC108628228 [Ceratina calcarata]|uniref:non-specific serine/threonine protein kinase n=1 Tax=Ceratina calcarata TaxID=156304 RepID=A0AAJ7WDG3_9HYME|nr:uncharacterized protein LOC108628228 [Ceratina calcarata]
MSGPAEVHAQIDLHVICSDKYPDEAPKIELQNSRGLSHSQISVLNNDLVELSERLQGEVMIFELAQHVQKYLHKHNKPSYNSFYDEMVSRNQEKIEYEMLEKQLKEDKERQVLQDEIQKRQEALKAEHRNRKESIWLYSEQPNNPSQSIPSSPQDRSRIYSRRRCVSSSESSDSYLCEHKGTKLLHFVYNKGERQVYRAKCMGHSPKGSVVYAGVDMTTGELFAISEWTLKINNSIEQSSIQHIMKQVGSLEQEVNHLHKLHHPNLVHYLNMKYLQEEDNIFVYILQEFVIGTSCSFFLLENIPVDIDLLRYMATGILSALRYLHENNVVHKDLRDTSIYIDHTGIVKLSDYSLNRRLSDIYQLCTLVKPEPDFPSIQGRGGKKIDIYRFGVLMFSLLNGFIVSGDRIDLTTITQPDLQDFLSKCLISDERKRWSVEQLLQHSFIKTPLGYALSPPKLPRRDEQEDHQPEKPDVDIRQYVPPLGGHSRITNEFEILKWLGRGAFGDVIKVKNKLDGGIYAIKRIKLNPRNKQLNRKITREVKLLSRMNHENVVRYYNSWIESAIITDTIDIDSSILTSDNKSLDPPSSSIIDNIERLAPPLKEAEWNVSYKSRTNTTHPADSDDDNSDESSDSDSDEDCGFIRQLRMDSSDSIEFERDTNYQSSASDIKDDENKNVTESEEPVREIQFMYIQMEFCEKSTLRTAMDSGLYEDQERVWRLFREIVEGLAHIHQQGMIHRDLKPVNIFLDSNDHVKIGDFGLATTNILSSFVQMETDKDGQSTEKGFSYGTEDLGSLTGQVGTALYVAPEVTTKAAKAIYNQKVDIYSLGIILFEMCYKPLATGMERIKVLHNLRLKEIVLPPEIQQSDMSRQVHILRWLLNHDPSQRPTAQELLSSDYLPPQRLEETELQEMIRRTLSNNQSKAYKYLISCCFMQEVSPAEDFTYDMNLPSKVHVNSISWKRNQERVKRKVIEVFQRHGGVYLGTPLLIPKSQQFCNFSNSNVQLMTRNGNIVCIPHDLRTPFARYVVWNNVPHIRRYAIERVFREKKVLGFHPRELYECAFDIISPTPDNLLMEAELIYIVWEIINELPPLQERNFTIRLNHTSLLQAVLMYCGIDQEKYQDMYSILRDARDGKFTKFQVQTHLISLCLTDQAMETLFNLFETESSIAKIRSVLKTITRRKGDAAALAREGLKEIETVTENIEALGVKWLVVVVPLLVHNINQHSGIIYQITCEVTRHKRRSGEEVISAGGRYDKMLNSFKKILEPTEMASKEIKQYGAGISISLEKLVSAVSEMTDSLDCKYGIDVAISCIGNRNREKEMIDLLKELWNLGLRVTILDIPSLEEILEHCRENSINHVILLKSSEMGSVRIQSWERDRFQEKRMGNQEIAEFFQRLESSTPILNRSESKTSATDSFSSNNPVNVNINFILSERDKLSSSSRRSLKNSMIAQMSPHFQRITHKIPIEVFAVFLEMNVIRTIISFLEIDEENQNFLKSIQVIIDKHPRHKKYIKEICEEMQEVRKEKQRPVLILYSLNDSQYMTLFKHNIFTMESFTETFKFHKRSSSQLDKCSLEKSELEAQLNSKKKDIQEKQKKIFELQDKVSTMTQLEAQIKEKTKRLESFSKERDTLERELITTKSELTGIKRTLELERQERRDLETRALSLIKDAKRKWENAEREKIAQLNKHIESQTVRITELCTSNNEMSSRLQRTECELETANAELHKLRVFQMQYKESLAKTRELNRQSVQGVETKLEEIAARAHNQIAELRSKLDLEVAKNTDLETKLRNEQDSNHCRQSRLNVALELAQNELKDCQEQLRSIQATIPARDTEIEALKKQLQERSKQLENAIASEQMVATLQEQLEITKLENEQLKQQLQVIKSDLTETMMNLEQSEALALNLEQVAQDKAALQKRLQDSLDKEEEHLRKVGNLEELLRRLEQSVTKLETENATLKLETVQVPSTSTISKMEIVKTDTHLQEQVRKLEQELQTMKENLSAERQITKQMQLNLWKKEKELSDANLDKRIAVRESKKADEKIKTLQEEKQKLIERLDQKVKEEEEKSKRLLKELNSAKASLNDITKESSRNKLQADSAQRTLTQANHQMEELQSSSASLRRELDAARKQVRANEDRVDSLTTENHRLSQSIAKHSEEKREFESKIEKLEQEIRGYELNTELLKETCTVLEEQLTDYERLTSDHETRENILIQDKMKLQKDLEATESKLREARTAQNEERSRRLTVERNIERLESEISDIESERNSLITQRDQYKQLVQELSSQVEDLTNKCGELEYELSEVKRSLEATKGESRMVKEESSQHLTRVHELKEANFALMNDLQNSIDQGQELRTRISELESILEEMRQFYQEREVKAESTRQQQTKLIDYLQLKLEECSKKKKTMCDKILGPKHKENVPPSGIGMPVGYRELENQLTKERAKVKALTDQLLALKAMHITSAPSSPTAPPDIRNVNYTTEQLTSSLSKRLTPQRIGHNIPHRFEVGLPMRAGKCSACFDSIQFGKRAAICSECQVMTHLKCAVNIPATCGLPGGFVKQFGKSWRNSDESLLTGSVQTLSIDQPDQPEKVYISYHHCVFCNIICYNISFPSPGMSPVNRLDLIDKDGFTVLDTVHQPDVMGTAKSDIQFIFRVESNSSTTCWPTSRLDIMALSHTDKKNWLKALKLVTSQTNSSNIHKSKKYQTILRLEKNQLDLNCAVNLPEENVLLLGAEEGLFSYCGVKSRTLTAIRGVTRVHQLTLHPHLGIALMIAGENRQLVSCGLRQLRSNAVAAEYSRPAINTTPVLTGTDSCHLYQLEEDMLCAATATHVILLKWHTGEESGEFIGVRELETTEPCSCAIFTQNILIVGCNKFFQIDLQTYCVDEFPEEDDSSVKAALSGVAKLGIFPVCVLNVSPVPGKVELLLCYNEFGMFVNENGQRTRSIDPTWNHLPFAFAFRKPYLFIIHFSSVEIVKLDKNAYTSSTKNPERILIELSSPRYLGVGGPKSIYVATVNSFLELLKIEGSSNIPELNGSLTSLDTLDPDDESSSEFSFTSSLMENLDCLGKKVHFAGIPKH